MCLWCYFQNIKVIKFQMNMTWLPDFWHALLVNYWSNLYLISPELFYCTTVTFREEKEGFGVFLREIALPHLLK